MNLPKLYSVAMPTPHLESLEPDPNDCGTNHFICWNPSKDYSQDDFTKLLRQLRKKHGDSVDVLFTLEKEYGFQFLDVLEYRYVDDRTMHIGNRL
jgi:hypothetical protein